MTNLKKGIALILQAFLHEKYTQSLCLDSSSRIEPHNFDINNS